MGYYNNYYKRKTGFNFGNSEITKGEIIILVIAFIIWSTMCIFINTAIKNSTLEKHSMYYKAVQIEEDSDLFEYAMRTHAGNCLVYDELKAIDTVSLPELKGKYLAVKKVTEKYTEHVTYEENEDGEEERVVTYEWDHYLTEIFTSEKVTFSGQEFPYEKVKADNFKRLTLNEESVSKGLTKKIYGNIIYEDSYFFEDIGDKRYYYSVIPESQKVTVFANLMENTMYSVNGGESVKIHYDTIENVIESLENSQNVPNIIFTIFWYILYLVFAYLFVKQRNRWADC